MEEKQIQDCLNFLQEVYAKTQTPKRVHMTYLSEKHELHSSVVTVLHRSGLCVRASRNVWKYTSTVPPNVQTAIKLLEMSAALRKEYNQMNKERAEKAKQEAEEASNVNDVVETTKPKSTTSWSILFGLIKFKTTRND